MRGWNPVLKMTEAQHREKLYGKPKESARMVGTGFNRHWEYRGVRMVTRRLPGWAAGQVWTSDAIRGQHYEAPFKTVLMAKIDKALDMVPSVINPTK